MKTIARLTIAAVAVLAMAISPVRAAETVSAEVLWEPPTATSTAVTSAILNTGDLESITVYVKPIFVSGAANRVTTISCHRTNGDEIFAFDAVTATTVAPSEIHISAKANWDDDASATTKPTGATFFTSEPCRRTKVSVATASGPVRVFATGIRRKK